ncbi:ABC transporter substrate-binding protein [Ottowia pentelensis]|uniref:ABC transporter substrate-binding protein n=1 Tax=Ottowia pentelensis TaxID=511108 RepID=UPI00363F8055
MLTACPSPDLQRRRWLAAAPALGLLASPALRAQTRPERPRVTVAVGGLATLYYLPLTLAQQLHYFDDEGLSVDLQDHPGGGPAEQAMVSGHADLVAGAYEHTVILRQRGINCRAFTLLGRAPQAVLGVGGPALPEFRDARQLRGQRIGISAADSATQWFARLVLARAGVRADEVSWVGVGTGAAAAAALQEGRIGAIASVDPVISQLEFRAQIRVIADARSLRSTQQLYGGPMPGGCLYAPQGFIVRYPNTVQALANALCAPSSGCRRPAPATSCAPCPKAPCRATARSTCRRWTRCARRFRPTA